MSREGWIELFVFLHVLGAITAVGPSLTYGLWRSRSERAGPEHRAFVLETIGWVDRHLALPSFGMQAVTGGFLIYLLRIRFFHTAWLLTGVGIYGVTAVFGALIYAPVVKLQRTLAEQMAMGSTDDVAAQYQSVARRARLMGVTVILLTIAILYFMIVKPSMWSAG